MNEKVGLIYSEQFRKLHSRKTHPDTPKRVKEIMRHLKHRPILNHIRQIDINTSSTEPLSLVHSQRYIDFIKMTSQNAISEDVYIDEDTYITNDSFEVASLAVNSVCRGIDALYNENMTAVFCVVRPPGHHARIDSAGGFCIFNNVAIAAKYAQKNYDVRKVLILDWDAHHGNGTQDIFYEDDTVYYLSIHESPSYPGSGLSSEIGAGIGIGYTKNYPVPLWSHDDEYRKIFNGAIQQAFDTFDPELTIISAGFDGHIADPVGHLKLSTSIYGEMTQKVIDLARNIPILSVLEGGYSTGALARCVEEHLNKLINASQRQ